MLFTCRLAMQLFILRRCWWKGKGPGFLSPGNTTYHTRITRASHTTLTGPKMLSTEISSIYQEHREEEVPELHEVCVTLG